MRHARRNDARNAVSMWALGLTMALVLPLTAFGIQPSIAGGATSPSIEFLNPSSFAAGGSDAIIVSDRATGAPRESEEGYRISAWVSGAPVNAGVEFELLSGGISLDTLDAVTEVGPDTFDYRWNIPDTLPDGPYTLRATLFSANEAIDHADIDITIARLGDRAAVDYPFPGASANGWPGGSSFGTYAPLAPALPQEGKAERGKPVGNIEASYTTGIGVSSGTTRVRAFYTTSDPGSKPKWDACGTEKTPGHPIPSGAADDGVRCTLDTRSEQRAITAVAVLANSSPGEYDALANQAGDAARVFVPYRQVPKDFEITEGDGGILTEGAGGFPCRTITARLFDQRGREVNAANIDVHATGPSDKLLLDTGLAPASDIKHADRHHSLEEPGFDCFVENDRSGTSQSEHQMLGAPDVKHGEADVAGTDDGGSWSFSFKVPANQVVDGRHSVHATMHVDEADDGCHANDDLLTDGELWDRASVGLGKAADAAPSPTVSSLERCDRLPGLRAIRLRASRTRVPEHHKVRFSGAITGVAECTKGELVRLGTRKGSQGRFRRIATARSQADGHFRFDKIKVVRTREYRAKVPRTDVCVGSRSRIVRVRVTNPS